ncbi:MAG TPA: amidohydrolase family protein, partial [Candidatus Baltobacteraceae bacterium]
MLATIFENATVVDGTGAPGYTTDVAVADDRIALIGDLHDREALTRVDARGKVLSPGFIDVHSHSDELWLVLPRCDGKIAQGVTTEIGGNCGISPFPLIGDARTPIERHARHYGLDVTWSTLDEFFAAVERNGVALNVATLVGLGTTRRAIAGESDRKLEAAELLAQAALVRAACEQGALGASSGLIYVPGRYADTAELIELAAAARAGGAPRYASHVRSEADDLFAAIDEALEIGESAQVAVQCSHHKAQYP